MISFTSQLGAITKNSLGGSRLPSLVTIGRPRSVRPPPYRGALVAPSRGAEWRGSSFNRNKGLVVSLHSLTWSPSFPSSCRPFPPSLPPINLLPHTFPPLLSSSTSSPDSAHFYLTFLLFHPAFLTSLLSSSSPYFLLALYITLSVSRLPV